MQQDYKYKVLLIDTDQEYLQNTRQLLLENDYLVYIASTSVEGIEMAKSVSPEIILLDIVLDEKDGIEVCTELRNNSKLKKSFITFLSEQSENYVRISGLNAGADDFITKPIPNHYLLAKIRAWKKRLSLANGLKSMNSQICGSIKVDFERYLIVNNNKEVELPKKEFEIFSLFVEHPQKVFTRDEIRKLVWDNTDKINNRTIDVHIKKMREKLGERLIKTIKGVGYKLNCC